MKKKLLFVLILLFATSVYSQEELFNNNKQDEAVKLDARSSQMDFVPNQLLVKFKDELNAVLGKTSGGLAFLGTASVDEIFAKYKVTSAEKLFPNEKRKFQKRVFKTASGKPIEEQSLHNIYKLEFAEAQNLYNLMEELKQNPNVEYAEPNYILSIVADKPVSPELNEKEMLEWVKGHYVNRVHDQEQEQEHEQEHETFTPPNDPLYPQQWYIDAVQADSVWKQTTGDTTQVIAILDTGVDWLHPDLKNKIWINKAEIPDNGNDDDHDGYVDDVRGWDWINNDNNPTDDNSHGTHVAGIAAAEANNGIGIAGVNWKAKIMALKVFQSSGRGDAATITQGINYAATHGATVINMSFGSYARSLTMEAALANAYATCVLVAAAGNDGLPLESCIPASPFFPAALSFVFGVQAPDGVFSNYDCNGPTFSNTSDLLNYEMKAPGTNIISTIPRGNYRVYQGTSMAAPIVSGSISLYRELIPSTDETNEFMWVKLIQSTEQFLNLKKALTIQPKPEIWFLNNVMVDTLGTDDRDGRVDAGETIQLWFRARNTGGQVDSVYWKIKLAEFEDPTTCDIVKSTSYLGSISPYATRTSEKDPMIFEISSTVAHDRDITFVLSSWYKGCIDTLKQNFVFTVENGTQLSGVMDSTLVLTPNKLWIVNESFRVGYNGHLLIKPGTKIKIYGGKYIAVRGWVSAIGTADSMIVVEGGGSIFGNGSGFIRDGSQTLESTYKYVLFRQMGNALDLGPTSGGGYANVYNCTFIGDPSIHFRGINNFKNNTVLNGNWGGYTNGAIKFNNFISGSVNGSTVYWPVGTETKYNNFILPTSSSGWNNPTIGGLGWSKVIAPTHQFNSFISDGRHTIVNTNYQFGGDIQYMQNEYWGTTNKEKIKKMISDFWSSPLLPQLEYEPKLLSPPDSCHGVVWKVLVNGQDAQDEKVDPIGAGRQRFDIYFNRPMNKLIIPNVSFGIRYPYSSNLVNENGSWSDDGKIWTVYKTVKLYTGDGINRVRVSDAKDLEGWEIPIEDMRFEFLIDAAGSASTDFLATAGIGKVKLEWPTPQDLPTLLGYNIYRFTNLTDTTFTEPAQINNQLVTDTTYTDYNVNPHKKYYYKYKVVRTDFTESDFSKVVNATVLTASRGDANGSMTVDVMDIVSMVGYILGQNPQPFIFEAGDVNADNAINILDVVGVVNIILGKSPNPSVNKVGSVVAKLELKNDKLELQSDVAVSGIQFTLRGKNLDKLQFSSSNEIRRFELASGGKGDTVKTFIIYSLSNNILKQGSYSLGSFAELDNSAHLDNVIVSDESGKGILTNVVNKGVPSIPAEYYLSQNYPNPFNGSTIIQYGLPKKGDVRIVIYNILGQRVRTLNEGERNAGRYQVIWDGKDDREGVVSSGVYIYRIETAEYMKAKKLVYMK